MKRYSLSAALLLLLSAGFTFAQNQTCPRPDCPNQGICQRKGNGNGQGNGNCDGSCPRRGQKDPQSGGENRQGTQQGGGMRWGRPMR